MNEFVYVAVERGLRNSLVLLDVEVVVDGLSYIFAAGAVYQQASARLGINNSCQSNRHESEEDGGAHTVWMRIGKSPSFS